MKKAVVFIANYAYQEQLLTTIKSIMCYNRNIHFYVINSDFPSEWIHSLNKRLAPLQSKISSKRIDPEQVKQYKTNIHYTVFLRYYISDVVEEDRVLYLDCDIVVNSSIDELFELDMGDYPVAAIKDWGAQCYFGSHSFNSGVLLVNNIYWKKENMTQKLIELTNEWHDKVPQDDQSILNMVFENNWLELPIIWNFVPIHRHILGVDIDMERLPNIIHYLTHRKPWTEHILTMWRDIWWFYNGLEWSDIQTAYACMQYTKISQLETVVKRFYQYDIIAWVYTYTDRLMHIDYLAEQLPNVKFVVVAPTTVSYGMTKRLGLTNVSIASGLLEQDPLLLNIEKTSDIYLDINEWEVVGTVVERAQALGKPIFAFDATKHGDYHQHVVSCERPEDMVAAIQSWIASQKK